mgnify:CR=1 FL=1
MQDRTTQNINIKESKNQQDKKNKVCERFTLS